MTDGENSSSSDDKNTLTHSAIAKSKNVTVYTVAFSASDRGKNSCRSAPRRRRHSFTPTCDRADCRLQVDRPGCYRPSTVDAVKMLTAARSRGGARLSTAFFRVRRTDCSTCPKAWVRNIKPDGNPAGGGCRADVNTKMAAATLRYGLARSAPRLTRLRAFSEV